MSPGGLCGCNPLLSSSSLAMLILFKQTKTFPSHCNFRGEEKGPREELTQNHNLIKGHYQSLMCVRL
jgi:hypothetical protein